MAIDEIPTMAHHKDVGAVRKQLLLPLLFVLLLATCIPFLWLIADGHQPFSLCSSSNGNGNEMESSRLSSSSSSSSIRLRRVFKSYEEYKKLQLNKTLNPRLRKVWTTRDWRRKVDVFSSVFRELKKEGVLSAESKALCIGARVGQEVVALRETGTTDVVGIDLVPYPPLVIEGDMHSHPFPNDTFDFEFSNAFDHSVYPWLFVSEMERTLKGGGVAVVHVAAHTRGDKYSVNDLGSPNALVALFKKSTLVRIREVDAFGLDTEIVLRKNKIS